MNDKSKFITLGWTILEAKYFYYADAGNKNCRADTWYDNIENEYKVLANKLNLTPTASNYVGFPYNRPCGRLVAKRCQSKNFKYTIDLRND